MRKAAFTRRLSVYVTMDKKRLRQIKKVTVSKKIPHIVELCVQIYTTYRNYYNTRAYFFGFFFQTHLIITQTTNNQYINK